MKLFFFLGTEAELIKVFPVILEAKARGIPYKIIASGQNNIVDSVIFKKIDCGPVDLELSHESDIKKNAAGLLLWWIRTYKSALKQMKAAFPQTDFSSARMLVHGDTVSTFMGAQLGYQLGMRVCHIEAGLRSHNLLNPFPEEIDRRLTGRRARMHFAPGDVPASNLKKAKGVVVNTKSNTLLDSLALSKTIPAGGDLEKILTEDYFVFVMHRQENLMAKAFVCDVVREVVKAAETRKCVLVLHEITKNAFFKFGLMDSLQNNKNIILQPRVNYFDFMKLLQSAAFVITDGGSNQEELFYMGKPCLIMRKTTERNEGLGHNARLFNGKASDIKTFIEEIKEIEQSRELPSESPSKIIIDALLKN